jgi:hypothetical protein
MWVEVRGGGGKKKRRGTNVVNYNILTFVDGNNLSAIPVLNSDV